MARILTTERWITTTDEAGDEQAFVYCVIERGNLENGPCKVGISADPNKRLCQLQTGNWRKLELAWTISVPSRAVALSIEAHCLMQFRPNPYDDSIKSQLSSEWVSTYPLRVLEQALRVLRNCYETVERAA